jgi:hypothetical protein
MLLDCARIGFRALLEGREFFVEILRRRQPAAQCLLQNRP